MKHISYVAIFVVLCSLGGFFIVFFMRTPTLKNDSKQEIKGSIQSNDEKPPTKLALRTFMNEKRTGLLVNLYTHNTTGSKRLVEFPTVKTDPHYYLYRQLIERKQKLYIAKLDIGSSSSNNNCYQYEIVSTTGEAVAKRSFCYPSVVVAGYHKCGTSALYQYMSMCTNSFGGALKENCPINQMKTSLINYFNSLPQVDVKGHLSLHDTKLNRESKLLQQHPHVDSIVLVGGCISRESNLLLANLLRPRTTYLFLARNYADWLWSAYNFWCSPTYDKECTRGNWVRPGFHKRSPELFDDIVMNNKVHEEKIEHVANQTGPSPIFILPRPACSAANRFYQDLENEYLRPLQLASNNSKVAIIASEQFNQATIGFAKEIHDITGLIMEPEVLLKFSTKKYNTQSSSVSKGERKHTDVALFQPGLYQASEFKPMLNKTRSFLDSCWYNDCIWLSNVTGYAYQCGGGTGTAAQK